MTGEVMGMEGELTIHTLPLDALRARAAEAQRLIAQAREIARLSFDGQHETQGPPSEGSDPSRRVGQLLDAAQRLLPGMSPLAEERLRSSRSKPQERESGWRRVTLRAGPERAIESIERADILERVAADAAVLIAEIERCSSTTLRAADVAAVATDKRATRS